MDLWLFLVILLATVIFILVVGDNTSITRCPYPGGKCFDGNGKYQYKGRGHPDENVDVLLNRIDWLAKNSDKNPLYSTSYVIAFSLALGVLLVLYASSCYILTPAEYVIILFASFVIVLSVTNLMNFHTNRYPTYYVRRNIEYIRDQLSYSSKEPPCPKKDTFVPHRSKVRDILKH